MDNRKVSNHGDLILKPVKIKVPKTAESAEVHVLQDSGATGNRHEVAGKSLVSRWTDKEGREFVSCPEDFTLRHVGGDCEHGEQVLAAGAYEVLHEDEYDPFKNELRRVLD